MADPGNTYDSDPPARIVPNKGGRPPEKLEKAMAFISQRLANGDKATCDLVREWEAMGESKGTFFNARGKMVRDGLVAVDDSKRPQMCHLIKP